MLIEEQFRKSVAFICLPNKQGRMVPRATATLVGAGGCPSNRGI
jgi:hypothetical protein